MDLTKVFDDVTWANGVIEQDELKSIQEFSVKERRRKDPHAVCSWLKIELLKHDIQSDIIALINRKNVLANKLNFN